MQDVLSLIVMFMVVLGVVELAKVIVSAVGMFLYRVAFAIYFVVKNEDVDYKTLLVKGDIIRPVEQVEIMSFSQVRHMKKSA